MDFKRQEKIQLGQTGFFLGDLPNLVAGSLEVEIWCCPHCGKIELYLPNFAEELCTEPEFESQELPPEELQNVVKVSMSGVPQIQCPSCGVTHDFDCPRCPNCNYKY